MTSRKQKAWGWCSKYIRLRDALRYCKRMRIDISQFARIEDLPVKCVTCPTVKPWIRMDAGHCFGRGLGGGSGAYFDERNINTQCKPCNAFEGGRTDIHKLFILRRYGQQVLDELEILHHGGRRYQNGKIEAFGQLYKSMFEELQNGL